MNIILKRTLLLGLLMLSGCESVSNTNTQLEVTLHQQMTHSYCYQYMYGDYNAAVDYDKAFYWCGKSIIERNPNAMTLMGELYFLGLGRDKDLKKAYYWYEKAAERGHNHGQFMLAHMNKNEIGVS